MKKTGRRILAIILAGAMILGAVAGGLYAALHSDVVAVQAKGPNSVSVEEYYSGINENSASLLEDLRSLNTKYRGTTPGYDGLRSLYKTIDADPNGSGKILGFYDNQLIGPSWDGGNTWNREHVWPNSIGGGSVDDDAYMPRPTCKESNSSRGNAYFAADGAFDPGYEIPNYRGISARIIFYCMTINSSLKLEDKAILSPKTGSNTMGKISDLLKWNLQYLPSSSSTAAAELRCEYNRNNIIQKQVQGNRNPFVDHPEYACKIWGNYNSETKKICGGVTPTKTLSSLTYTGNPSKTTYVEGDTFNSSGLTVTATFSDGSKDNVTSSVVWSSLVAGKSTVTGTYTYEGTSKTVTISGLTVTAKIIEPIGTTIAPVSKTTYEVGESITLTATVDPSNATNKIITFESTDESIATVDPNTGLVRFVGEGAVSINALAYNGLGDQIDFVVTAPSIVQVVSIIADEDTKLLNIGQVYSPGYTIMPKNASNKNVSFSSSDSSIVKVENGAFKAVAPGTCTLTITTEDGNKTADIEVTVTSKEIRSIRVNSNPIKTEYFVGQEFNPYGMEVEAVFEDQSTIDISDQVTFDYDFSAAKESSDVIVSYKSFSVNIVVSVIDDEPEVEDFANDFALEFNEAMEDIEVEEVTEETWTSLKTDFNKLDGETRDFLKNYQYSSRKRAAKEFDAKYIESFLKTYDEIIETNLDFEDFIGRRKAPVTDPVLQSIYVVNPKTKYNVGDSFTKPVVKGVFDKGEDQVLTGATFDGFDSSSIIDQQAILVCYEDFFVVYTIEIVEAPAPIEPKQEKESNPVGTAMAVIVWSMFGIAALFTIIRACQKEK